jgi:HPt (histidine-containing phosphotransfer) domain-containing protein
VLKATLDRWLDSHCAGVGATDPPPVPVTTAVDVAVLQSFVGDDAELLAELLGDFRDSLAAGAGQVRSAADACCGTAVASAAHKLKSSSRQVGARALGEICAQLESDGLEGRIDAALLLRFDDEVTAVDDWLAARAGADRGLGSETLGAAEMR